MDVTKEARDLARLLKSAAGGEAAAEAEAEESPTRAAFDQAAEELRKAAGLPGPEDEDEETDAGDDDAEEAPEADADDEATEESGEDAADDTEPTPENLKKAWDDFMKKKKNGKKNGKKGKKDNEDDDDEEDEAYKSRAVAETVAADPEAEAAMDIEPFLKALVHGIDRRLDAIEATVAKAAKAQEAVFAVQKSAAGLALSHGDLVREVHEVVSAAGGQPAERRGRLRVVERFGKSAAEDGADYDPQEAKAKLLELAKSKALSPEQIGVCEMRINHGQELPAYFAKHFAGSGE